MTSLFDEIRYGFRLLLRQPAFTLTAVLVLAVGIGINSAVFSLVYAVLLRPLPYQNPEQVYLIWNRVPAAQKVRELWSSPDFREAQKNATSFSGLAATRQHVGTFSDGSRAERVRCLLVSANYLPLLGLHPLMGRHFLPQENTPSTGNVVILTEGFWESRFGRDPAVIGKALNLDQEPHTIVGVLPYKPGNYQTPDLYAALVDPPNVDNLRRYKTLEVVGRLKPGVSSAQAEAELNSLAQALQPEESDPNRRWQPYLQPVHEFAVGDSREPLLLLGLAVSMVLLIACANLANLLLVRATSRIRELAMRITLGAGQWRVFRQMLIESSVLGILGGLAGLVVAYWAIRLIGSMDFASIRRLDQAELNWQVVLFAFGAGFLCSLLFGLAPAWLALRLNLAEVLKDSSRASSGSIQRSRGRATLVVLEVALSVVLLVAAGLLLRTFHELSQADLGYEPDGLVVTRVVLPPNRYPTEASRLIYIERIMAGLRGIPGVQSFSYGTSTPLTALSWRIELQPPDGGGRPESAYYAAVGPGFFETLGARLKSGRAFDDRDKQNTEKVCVITEELERTLFPEGNAVGRMVRGAVFGEPVDARVVGVVREIKYRQPDDPPRRILYQAQQQMLWPYLTFIVRTRGEESAVMSPLRSVFSEVDRDLPLGNIETMRGLADRLYADRRLALNLLGVFAVLALGLAAFGLYGVLSVAVTQRNREIGVRVAMGASRSDIARLVVGEGIVLAGVGSAAGLALAPLAGRLLADLLYQVKPLDLATYASVCAAVVALAVLASALPALRAAGVDPATALRKE